MLDHTLARARERSVGNVVATQGDARQLPYDDDSFDAVFLTTVLGEIPERERALAEIGRVVKPDGRVVVGEIFGDPHWVSPWTLRRLAEAAGLSFDRRVGSPLGYFAVVTPSRSSAE